MEDEFSAGISTQKHFNSQTWKRFSEFLEAELQKKYGKFITNVKLTEADQNNNIGEPSCAPTIITSANNLQVPQDPGGNGDGDELEISLVTEVKNVLPPAADAATSMIILLANVPPFQMGGTHHIELQNKPGNNSKRKRRAPKSVRLGQLFFPLTVQAGLSLVEAAFSTGSLSSAAEAKQVLRVAAMSNVVGYIGCLSEMLLRRHIRPVAARIAGRVGSTAAVFGFLATMGTLLPLAPKEIFALSCIVSLLFFTAVTMN